MTHFAFEEAGYTLARAEGRELPEGRVDPALAKELNQQIRLLAERLPGDENHTYGFSCEDGCDSLVPLTLAEFDKAGGAWLEGHKPRPE
jgi:hypothetical protein